MLAKPATFEPDASTTSSTAAPTQERLEDAHFLFILLCGNLMFSVCINEGIKTKVSILNHDMPFKWL